MDSALIVSETKTNIDFFTKMLHAAACNRIVSVSLCGDARRLLLERDFDLIIINAPLRDEFGENLARDIAAKGFSQVILLVKGEYFEEISAITESDGVFTLKKPISKSIFRSALKLARAGYNQINRLRAENSRLAQKIEDIRIIDRAKCILISCFNITEQEAHRFIEKQSMNMRITRKEVAKGILKTYEK